ncbi:MFS transporter [Paracoccus stylophorae]|uniref:MFS transporter n=1 Tax=Paracoccus stylophorae TaxID=659350 RepID=A0ABY7STW0_9RHOB|nr:MFS transporter [Paracoccus stylophorae]WCR10460.1 MFS transporter [Paracoccus stylophorae]
MPDADTGPPGPWRRDPAGSAAGISEIQFAAPSALIRIREDQAKLRGFIRQITSRPLPEDTALSVGGEGGSRTSVRQAFQDGRARMTLLFWLCAFVMLMGFYFLAFWTPTLLGLAGLPASQAILGTAALNLGGVLCGLGVGKVADRFGGRVVLSGMFVMGAASLGMASASTGSVVLLMVAIFLAGAAWIAGQALIVVVLAQSYPAQIRATVIGSTLAVGRLGAIVSPMVASVPMALGWSPEAILLIPIVPALIAAAAVLFARPVDPATSSR